MMDGLGVILGGVALGVAIVTVVIAEQRHRRATRRAARGQRTDAHLLQLIKALAGREHRGLDGRPAVLRSQFGEDLVVLELFDWSATGFFVEVGAYDGRTYSVSAALESVGWDGVLVEPSPSLYERARAARPGARIVNAALSRRGSSGTAEFVQLEATGDYDASSHLAATDERAATKRPPAGVRARTIAVAVTTMDAVLEGLTDRVDCASIDVEGHELDLLDGFDLDRFRPGVVLIEDHDEGESSPVHAHLAARGYRQAGWVAWNRVMIREDRADLLDRAERLFQHTGARRG